MRKFIFSFLLGCVVASYAIADTINNDAPMVIGEQNALADGVQRAAPPVARGGGITIGRPAISINTDSPLDMNWAGALELSDPALRPAAVELPFLPDYPIENLEIKLHLLNIKF